MAGRLSWVHSYEDLHFDHPQETHRMLPVASSPPPPPTTANTTSTMPATMTNGTGMATGTRREDNSTGASASSSSHSSTPPDPHDADPPISPVSPTPASPEAGPSFLRTPRSASFARSPLNPNPFASPFARPGSRGSAHVTRIPSEESRALAQAHHNYHSGHQAYPSTPSTPSIRASMILYRLPDAADDLRPPSMPHAKGANRASMFSISGDSFMSLSSDSKYPAGMLDPERMHTHAHRTGGLVAYAYDPTLDDDAEADEEDALHDPTGKDPDIAPGAGFGIKGVRARRSWRGFKNLAALGVLIAALLCLFVVYPIIDNFRGDRRERMIVGNTRINATGQAEAESFDPRKRELAGQVLLAGAGAWAVDPDTPLEARRWVSGEGEVFDLVFSDEFGVDQRTFYPGDDSVWELTESAGGAGTSEGSLWVWSGNGQNKKWERDPEQQKQSLGEGTHGADLALRVRAPVCVQGGFVEVGVVEAGREKGRVRRRVFWDGTWHTIGDDGSGPVLGKMGSTGAVVLDLGFGVGASGPTHPPTQRPESRLLRIDYVRVFGRAPSGDLDLRGGETCEGAQVVDLVLDLA